MSSRNWIKSRVAILDPIFRPVNPSVKSIAPDQIHCLQNKQHLMVVRCNYIATAADLKCAGTKPLQNHAHHYPPSLSLLHNTFIIPLHLGYTAKALSAPSRLGPESEAAWGLNLSVHMP